MPTTLPFANLLDCGPGRHFASGPHLRIQVVRLSAGDGGREYRQPRHGDALAICLQGQARIEGEAATCDLDERDQALLSDGEAFRLQALNGEALVQLIWSPGPNPCQECWELNNRFYGFE